MSENGLVNHFKVNLCHVNSGVQNHQSYTLLAAVYKDMNNEALYFALSGFVSFNYLNLIRKTPGNKNANGFLVSKCWRVELRQLL